MLHANVTYWFTNNDGKNLHNDLVEHQLDKYFTCTIIPPSAFFYISFSLYFPLLLTNISQPKLVSLLETMDEIARNNPHCALDWKNHFQKKRYTIEHMMFLCYNLISWSQFQCMNWGYTCDDYKTLHYSTYNHTFQLLYFHLHVNKI